MAILLRQQKGSALTHGELDANFTTLEAADLDSAAVSAIVAADVPGLTFDSAAVLSIAGEIGLDSAATTALIDAAYINANVSVAMGDLTNVDITGIQNGQVLKWASGSSSFVPANDSAGAGGSSFDQTLNTTDDVVFNTVTADTVNTTPTVGTPSITSASNLLLEAGGSVTISKDSNGNGGGFRLASLDDTERGALSAANGEMIYNSTDGAFQIYQRGAWQSLGTPVHRFVLGANGTADYTFTDDENIYFPSGPVNDPALYLRRGEIYIFTNNSGGSHPFEIRVSSGGAAYNTGVTNNSAASGDIIFKVPMGAPTTLYYQCTAHATMGNTINIV